VLGVLAKSPKAFAEAMVAVPRTLRNMYVHAFQSYLWNCAASHRVETYGWERVVAGDLVMVEGAGEGDDVAIGGIERRRGFGAVHVVTEAEAAAGKYAVTDVVLPLLGKDSAMPAHATRDVFAEAARALGVEIDPARPPHRLQPFMLSSFSGGYRHVLLRPEGLGWVYHEYDSPTQDLAVSDLARLEAEVGRPTGGEVRKRKREAEGEGEAEGRGDGGAPAGAPAPGGGATKLAVELQFTLPSSAYATMVVRELIKSSTSTQAQMDLNEE